MAHPIGSKATKCPLPAQFVGPRSKLGSFRATVLTAGIVVGFGHADLPVAVAVTIDGEPVFVASCYGTRPMVDELIVRAVEA